MNDVSEEYLSWLNDEETTRGLASGVFPSTTEELTRFVEGVSSTIKTLSCLPMCDKTNDKHIGNIKLRSI
jgi:hypothetical protein